MSQAPDKRAAAVACMHIMALFYDTSAQSGVALRSRAFRSNGPTIVSSNNASGKPELIALVRAGV